MGDNCSRKGVPAIGELIAEHAALLDEAHLVSCALRGGDRSGGRALLIRMVTHLDRHVRREETGVFAALRAQGDHAAEVDQLATEHLDLDAAVAALDVDAPDVELSVAQFFVDLRAHLEREELGAFPVSVVTLDAAGWAVVHEAHRHTPTFLGEPAERQTVGEAMITAPQTMTVAATVGEVRTAFLDDHVHLVLLVEEGILLGTLVRDDLPADAPDGDPALTLAVLARRTVPPSAPAADARRVLMTRGERRLAVVDDDGALLGLLCLKQHGRGFCTDLEVDSHERDDRALAAIGSRSGTPG